MNNFTILPETFVQDLQAGCKTMLEVFRILLVIIIVLLAIAALLGHNRLGIIQLGLITIGVSFMSFAFLRPAYEFNNMELVTLPDAIVSPHLWVYKSLTYDDLVKLDTPAQYVYLIQDISVTGHIKIGRTNNPLRRLRQFGITLPFSISVVHIIRCKSSADAEYHFHTMYKDKRVRGEWFNLTPEDVEHIKSIKETSL